MTVTRLVARPLLASIFFVGGASALKNVDKTASMAAPLTDKVVPLAQQAAPGLPIPSDPRTLVRLNAAVQLVAGAALATGKSPRLAATALAVSLIPTTLAGHAFWKQSDPADRKSQQLQFAKNASILGGLLIASVDTDGKPGLPWRARRAAADVRREAKRVAKDARREAKLAKAQLV